MSSVSQPTAYRQVGSNGRLHEPGVPHRDAKTAVLIHAFVIVGAGTFGAMLLVSLILWLVHRSGSAFIDDHGREALNFVLSMLLYTVLLSISIIGIPLVWVPGVLMIVLPIRSAIAASNREYIRYPMTLRMF